MKASKTSKPSKHSLKRSRKHIRLLSAQEENTLSILLMAQNPQYRPEVFKGLLRLLPKNQREALTISTDMMKPTNSAMLRGTSEFSFLQFLRIRSLIQLLKTELFQEKHSAWEKLRKNAITWKADILNNHIPYQYRRRVYTCRFFCRVVF